MFQWIVRKCKIRTKKIDVNNNEPLFCPYSVEINKYSGSCNNILIHMQNDMFPMLLKTEMSKYL